MLFSVLVYSIRTAAGYYRAGSRCIDYIIVIIIFTGIRGGLFKSKYPCDLLARSVGLVGQTIPFIYLYQPLGFEATRKGVKITNIMFLEQYYLMSVDIEE